MIILKFDGEGPLKIINLQNLTISFPKNKQSFYTANNENYMVIFIGFFFRSKPDINLANFILGLTGDALNEYLKDIDGFFQIIKINLNNGAIDIYSDHVGSKIMYYRSVSETIYFSDSLKNLLEITKKNSLNKKKITDYFTFISDTGPDTFYKDIFKTCPREHLKFSGSKIHRHKYFDFEIKVDERSEQEICNNLRDLFIESVKNCSRKADIKIFSACSGGLDSSSITSSLCYLDEKKVIAKTVVFDGLDEKGSAKTDENEFSGSVVSKYGIEQNKIRLKNDGCISDMPEAITIFSEPKSLINGFIHHAIFKSLVHENNPVYLDGFAGDSVINHGYSSLHQYAKNFNYIRLFQEDEKIHFLRGAKYNYLRTFRKYIFPSLIPETILKFINTIRGKKNIYEKWHSRLNKKNRYKHLDKQVLKRYGIKPGIHANNPQKWHYANLISPEITSSIRDAIELASKYNVDINFPFLSKKLMQLSLNIPNNLKLKDGVDRYIFRKALADILPEEVFKRVTKSDLSPFSTIQMQGVNKSALIEKLKFRANDFFNYDYIINHVFNNIEDNAIEAYQLYEFAEWLEKNDLFLD